MFANNKIFCCFVELDSKNFVVLFWTNKIFCCFVVQKQNILLFCCVGTKYFVVLLFCFFAVLFFCCAGTKFFVVLFCNNKNFAVLLSFVTFCSVLLFSSTHSGNPFLVIFLRERLVNLGPPRVSRLIAV